MSVFSIPSGIIDRIESAMYRFWWGQKHDERKVYWIAWKKLCRPRKKGGLGLKDLRSFNKVMLGKQGWRILQNPTSLLSRTLQARYFRRRNFLTADVGYNPSFTWRSIIDGMEGLKLGMVWMIGNGCSINVWGDPWVCSKPDPFLLPPFTQMNEEIYVADLISQDSRNWDRELISALFSEEDSASIMAIPLRQLDENDFLMWRLERNGINSVRSGYKAWVEMVDTCLGDWISSTCLSLSSENQGLFFSLLWCAWFARNKLCFEEKLLEPGFVQIMALSLINDFKKANTRSISRTKTPTAVAQQVWFPLAPGRVKINTDASVAAGLLTGIGGVA
ncbi:hypothetical protein ACS0TY_021246 [Phlomoides rotata]